MKKRCILGKMKLTFSIDVIDRGSGVTIYEKKT